MKKFLLAVSLFTQLSCISSIESDVKLNKSPRTDREYFSVYEKHTRQVKVIGNFEHKFTAATTYLSPSMLNALRDRQQQLMDKNDLSFLSQDRENSLSFIVSLYAPEEDLMRLDDAKLWTILFKNSNQAMNQPTRIFRLREKMVLEAFFEFAIPWSREFIVSFTGASIGTENSLKMSTVDAQVEFKISADGSLSEP